MPGGRFSRQCTATLTLLTMLTAVGTDVTGPSVVDAAPVELERTLPAVGPLGPITVIGDSVLLGSIIYSPTVGDTLAQLGWGPIRMRTGEGYSTGEWPVPTHFKVSYWIAAWRQQGWDPTDLFVNLGANDSGFCGADAQCAYEAIMYLVDAIGPGHRIWWPKITRLYTHRPQQDAWNQALDRVDAERADFWTWDWPLELRTGGYVSYDGTHLEPESYRKRSRVMAREITADLAFARHSGGDAPLPQTIGDASEFVPLPPERVLDTRMGDSGPVAGGTAVDVDMTPYLPGGTTAVAVNLTTDGSNAPGYLTGFPCDRERGPVSNVNHTAAVPRGALAVVPLSASRHLCVFTLATGHVIVDLQGAFVPDAPDGVRFTPSDPPQRLLDTRDTGRAATLEIDVPDGAEAVSVNLTATNIDRPGWLKAYACDADPPLVSNVNYLPGDTVAGGAFVPVSPSGTICVQSLADVDVVVDLTGVFSPAGALRFVATDPTRMLDTRTGLGGWAPYQGGGQTIDVGVAPAGARAVTGTLTLVTPLRAGWLKTYPCGTQPPTSNVNGGAGSVFANAVTVGLNTAGRMCITAISATNTLFDVTGWWV